MSLCLHIQAHATNPLDLQVVGWRKESAELKADQLFMLEGAAKQGDVRATYLLYLELDKARYGFAQSASAQQLGKWALGLAQNNHPIGFRILCYLYRVDKYGLEKDLSKAFNACQKAAASGLIDGLVGLGLSYEYGYGVGKDLKKAAELYRSASDQGHEFGLINLGFMYENGRGVNKDVDQAVALFEKAAKAGSARAMYVLGYRYEMGQGVPKDIGKAYDWYTQAANLGNEAAMSSIGLLHQTGRGLSRSDVLAAQWYKKAADHGSALGMNNLANLYETGRGVLADEVKSMELYRRAAEYGNSHAMVNLGRRYELGLKHLKADPNLAALWYIKAYEIVSDATFSNGENVRERARRYLDGLIATGRVTDPLVNKNLSAIGKPAPLVQWVNLPAHTDQATTTIRVQLKDIGGGVGRVELRLNGVVIGELTNATARNAARADATPTNVDKHTHERSMSLRLPAGKHQLEVWAYNEENLIHFNRLQGSVLSTFQSTSKPRLFAVVLGVDDYENSALKLNFSAADAKAVGAVLTQQIATGSLYSGGQVRVLTSKADTSKANIVRTLQTLQDPEQVHTDDVFVFFAAGHGSYDKEASRYHMYTSDVLHLSADKLLQTSIVSEELRKLIGGIPAQKKLIALDTCHSGGFAKEGAQNFVQSRDALGEQNIVDAMKLRTGAAVFAASGSEQVAREGYEGHGVFSYFLLQGLKGAAARPNSTFISTDDLKIYLEEQLPAAMERKRWGKQAPSISTHQDGFPVAAR